MAFDVGWVDVQSESLDPSDPLYPAGSSIDVALDAMRACQVELPSPATRCGHWMVSCRACGFAITLRAAGRADDPCRVRVPCRLFR